MDDGDGVDDDLDNCPFTPLDLLPDLDGDGCPDPVIDEPQTNETENTTKETNPLENETGNGTSNNQSGTNNVEDQNGESDTNLSDENTSDNQDNGSEIGQEPKESKPPILNLAEFSVLLIILSSFLIFAGTGFAIRKR